MQAKTFIATRGKGIARATAGDTGAWQVETLLGDTAVRCLAVDPLDKQRVFAGTWTGHREGALRDCHSLTFHATRGEWLYEGGGTGSGHAFSRDGGATWSRTKQGLDRHYGWAVAADAEQPEVHYLSASPGPAKAHSENNAQAGIFRYDGTRWQRLAGGLPSPLNQMPYALITDPLAPGHVYAGLSNGEVWHSADHGDHWQPLPFHLGRIGRSLVML